MLSTKNRPLNVALWSLCVAGVVASGAAFAQSEENTPVRTPTHTVPFPIPKDDQPKRTNEPKQVTDIESSEPGAMGQPMLPGATNSTIGPQGGDATAVMGTTALPLQGAAPLLEGETNGTIGPPASPMATVPLGMSINDVPDSKKPIGKTESAAIIGAAVGCLGLSMFFLIKKKKAAFWTLGALAAAILAIAGFAWGTFGMFQ